MIPDESLRISGELHRTFFEGAWHGPSVTETLEGVTAEMAAARPVPSAHSIWELVLHMDAWMAEAAATTRGKAYESLKGDRDWPPVTDTSPEAWNQLLHRIKQTELSLEEAVKAFPQEELERSESSYYLLHGIAQHNAWHTGQIALLKKL